MADEDIAAQNKLIGLTVEIVSAYLKHNHVQAAELPTLIRSVNATLRSLDLASSAPPVAEQRRSSAAEIRRSITHEALISFEDGKPYKTLRRHLTLRGLSAEAYRAKWGLPVDYPMTAAAYSQQRSQLAFRVGLGRQRGTAGS